MLDLGLKGKAALIAGGSKGIGKMIAVAFAREGVNLAICARREDELEKVAEEIRALSTGRVLPIQADLTIYEDCRRFINEAVASFGRADILVYSANTPGGGKFSEISDEAWRYHLDVKLMGCIRCVREIVPHMQKNHWGRIVIIAGMAARVLRPESVDNGPICAALANFSKQVAAELAGNGILINTIHPDSTNTPRRAIRISQLANKQGITVEQIEEQERRRFPINRIIEPEDVANLALFLCSPRANAITGQSIAVDGGIGTAINY